MDFKSFDFKLKMSSMPSYEVPDISKYVDEMARTVQVDREEFIQNIAVTTGRELARAIMTDPDLFDEIIGALSSLCGNPIYNSKTLEDPMNDYVRDILGHGLQVRDQTRQGYQGIQDLLKRDRLEKLTFRLEIMDGQLESMKD